MKTKNKNTKVILLTALFFSILFLSQAVETRAGTSQNVTGWIWGGGQDSAGHLSGTGWISLNSSNMNDSTDYGVNIPTTDGVVSGYGWSPNLGWLSFNASDLGGCPVGTCNARREGNRIMGWARFLSIRDIAILGNSGTWQGWVSLSGAGYGVSVDPAGGVIHSGIDTSYAWSGSATDSIAELGWLDFSGASVEFPVVTYSCTNTNNVDTLHATLCNGDSEGLTADKDKTIATSCSANKCEYTCDQDYTKNAAGVCERNGQCNSDKIITTPQESAPESTPEAPLCTNGTASSVSSTGTAPFKWKWTCSGGTVADCATSRACTETATCNEDTKACFSKNHGEFVNKYNGCSNLNTCTNISSNCTDTERNLCLSVTISCPDSFVPDIWREVAP